MFSLSSVTYMWDPRVRTSSTSNYAAYKHVVLSGSWSPPLWLAHVVRGPPRAHVVGARPRALQWLAVTTARRVPAAGALPWSVDAFPRPADAPTPAVALLWPKLPPLGRCRHLMVHGPQPVPSSVAHAPADTALLGRHRRHPSATGARRRLVVASPAAGAHRCLPRETSRISHGWRLKTTSRVGPTCM
jgi:hypothetical protein